MRFQVKLTVSFSTGIDRRQNLTSVDVRFGFGLVEMAIPTNPIYRNFYENTGPDV